MKAICKTTGETIDVSKYGETCNVSGQLKCISGIVEPILFELKRAHYPNDFPIWQIEKIINDAENKIKDFKNSIIETDLRTRLNKQPNGEKS